jgi:flagellin-like protein
MIWKKEEGVSPVIAVILMVAITVVLSAVLYVMVSGMMGSTSSSPTVSLVWEEDSHGVGNYTGNIVRITGTKTLRLEHVSITVTHGGSTGEDTLNDLANGASITVGTLTLDYDDINNDAKLGAQDIFTITGGSSGDSIRLVYTPTGSQMGTSTLT